MTHAVTGESITRLAETDIVDNSTSTRYHYMDNLRAIAMLIGIFFHAALAYSPMMHNLWLSAENQNYVLFDIVAWFLHLFRMPLFFLISGFFALMLLEKRGIGGFLKNRSSRILAPFLIFLPIVFIALIAAIGWAVENIENLSPALKFVEYMMKNPDVPKPPFSTTHLWFLYNLYLFCLLISIAFKMNFFQRPLLKKLASPRFILLVLPILITPALYSQPAPHPAPERIYPQLWSFGFYGVLFFAGALIYQNQNLLDKLQKHLLLMLLLSVGAYAIIFWYLPKQITFQDIMAMEAGLPHSWQHFFIALLESFVAVHMTIASLLLGRKLMNKPNLAFRFVADSSYWVYIIHLPILFIIQYALLDVSASIWIKFLLSSFGTLAFGMISYLLLVKWTPIGWLLNGRNKSKKTA